MDKKVLRFFWGSAFSIFIICILVFVLLTSFMSTKTEQSAVEISRTYMSEMNAQIQQKFQTVVSIKLGQVQGIIKRTPPEEVSYGDEMLAQLRLSGEIRNFSCLALYSEDGEIEIIYGNGFTMVHPEDSIDSLTDNGNLVKRGIGIQQEKLLLLGEKVAYPMSNGKTSIALVAGMPMEELSQALFQYGEKGLADFYIIDVDGNYVVRNDEEKCDNFFEHAKLKYSQLNGNSPEEFINELRQSMEHGKNYSAEMMVDGELGNVYSTALSENSLWYLLAVLPDKVLGETLTDLDNIRLIIMVSSAGVILIAMSIIFIIYYRMSQQQMKEMAETKEHAIRAREKAVQAETEAVHANMAKSEFLSSMSHDIRTPMNAIIGMTEIAQRNMKDTDKVKECLYKVHLSSKHLLGLINDVLDMSKIESGKLTLNMASMSLRETMDDIVNIMQSQIKEKQQFFDIHIRDIISEQIVCDSVRLNQILLNLLSNAVKFTPEEGRIDIYMSQEPSPKGEHFVRTNLKVKDTGIGMSEEFQQKIWNTFEREENDQVRHIVGSGLGTSIAKRLVDLMGGTIHLESKLGEGTSFYVSFDFEKSDVNEEEMKLPAWNILIVDDDENLCRCAAANLEELGIHAEWSMDGMEAVNLIKEHHNQNNDYHFVLVDWKMPRMDGMETIHEIQNHVGKGVPIFLMSAYDGSEIESQVKASGIEGFISKPLFKSTLFERLRQYEDGIQKEENTDDESDELEFAGKRVLLAEDIELNWEVASEILSVFGLELEWAVNGKICLEMFEASEVGYYDAILMDIRMPVMNGYETTKAIRALERPDKDLPIIAMTADAFSDDAQHCKDIGMNAHIPKPLNIEECLNTLKRYLK